MRSYLQQLGFDADHIGSFNYQGSYAYTLGVKNYFDPEASANTRILVVDARGTSIMEELLADATSKPGNEYLGYKVYGVVDTFSPTQFGSIMVYGAGSKYGKFGHMDSYASEHRTEEQKGQMGLFQIYEHVNHNMDYYLKDLNLVECEYSYGGNDDSDGNYIPEEADTQTDAWTVRSELSIPGTPDWYRAGPIEGIVMEEKESFLEFVRMYAQVMGAKILYSTDEDPLQLEI